MRHEGARGVGGPGWIRTTDRRIMRARRELPALSLECFGYRRNTVAEMENYYRVRPNTLDFALFQSQERHKRLQLFLHAVTRFCCNKLLDVRADELALN